MKKLFVSGVSIILSLSLTAPAFALMQSDVTRRSIRGDRDRDVLNEISEGSREKSVITGTRKTHLERTKRLYEGRRNLRRRPKIGSDRYRVVRPNTRFFRRQSEEQSSLPPMIVQTGGSTYDKPTRRDIRGDNGYFYNVNDRNRDVLGEMEGGR